VLALKYGLGPAMGLVSVVYLFAGALLLSVAFLVLPRKSLALPL
jgi:hypothetical protein